MPGTSYVKLPRYCAVSTFFALRRYCALRDQYPVLREKHKGV
ncbi:MAG: hypothetical protein ABR543_13510 [Gemmatimonadaceae bacterium]